MAFDKTGTLTHGEPVVVAVTEHVAGARPIGRWPRPRRWRRDRSIPWRAPSSPRLAARASSVGGAADVRALPGLGAEGRWQDARVLVGNGRLFARARRLAARRWPRRTRASRREGRGAVHVAIDGVAVATLGVADRARDVAPDVVRLLREQGVTHVAMLTGDSPAAARAVAAAAGVTDVRAGLLPADKMAAIAELRAAHGAVAMVGDGVNDAPALAAADVGIAMGAIGSAAALETADIALMSDELQKIPYALRLSRATLRQHPRQHRALDRPEGRGAAAGDRRARRRSGWRCSPTPALRCSSSQTRCVCCDTSD